ncbi:uncharacterized protein LOC111705549 [Eurytemora carolleeae]|uniref:uncharacterized protein LOC111705549 n=1 Tax=Eurytemora carolleeae TaxID=1294199 RepID=UPI000C770596|nr:uncharacterized protein LOC111705549 [Eurytemora carolleeae]|eukprot:XP_023333903.1 uncharacterized protein LOC111705549 [Eurytemora affinis]
MVPSRPWSATEPRWNADRMFHVKKKGWEGLARGKKNLHHGQLLPGSTESEGEGPPRGRVACWSEGNSPRRCEDEVAEEPAPLIKAIRSELQRFQRRTPGSNTGILIFNEPDNTSGQ